MASRKLTYDDLWMIQDMSSIALSPDGRRVAFVMTYRDKANDEFRSVVMLLYLDEQGNAVGEPRQITGAGKSNIKPAWAPDSKRLLFLSNREGERHQIWLIDTDGGEARKLTNMLRGVNEVAWSPDGQWIAFTASASLTDDDDVLVGRKVLDEAARKKMQEQERTTPRTIQTVWYRLDGRGLFDKRSHLFVMPAPGNDDRPTDPATIRRLTTGDYDHVQPSWTADSLEIGVLCNRSDDRDRSWVNDLWAIHRETGEARRLTDGSLETVAYSWSPDGRQALLLGAQDMRKEGTGLVRLHLLSRDGGNFRTLLAHLDQDIAPTVGAYVGRPEQYLPQWSKDGRRAYVITTEQGRSNVHEVDIEQDTIKALTGGERNVFYLALLPQERGLLLVQSEPLQPWEFYLLPLGSNGQQAIQLTHLYDQFMANFVWSEPQRIQYKGANDELIDGWLIRPMGAKEGIRYPLLVSIHGGPQSAFGVAINPYHQYYAAQGFAVFYCNPHGSRGSGEAFMRQVEGDWGGWDYQDIIRGVDECIAMGVADPERLAVTGYSYGGYMSMYVIGHTDRFKAAAPMAGVSNLSSFVGTSDLGFWLVLQSKGYPWDPERAAYYRDRSPLTNAPRVTTPTLLLHAENDLRCPIEQTEQFYMALKMIGSVPVEFIRVPAAWHAGVSKPGLYFARGEKMLEWFGKYIEIRPEEYETDPC